MLKRYFKTFIVLVGVMSSLITTAQTDTIKRAAPTVEFTSYIDAFYAYDFGRPETGGSRQPFFYNHNRHNQFNVNNCFIKFSVNHAKYRGNIALHAGTYSTDNYAAELHPLKNIYEANVGVALSRKHSVWLDAGIFASHIGFESAVSIDNWTLTRSILAENSPYYLAGGKLTYAPNSQWEVAAIICNGWQRIQPVKGNSIPSFGTQLKYVPNAKLTFNWSTFIGTDDPDVSRRMRYFSNLYAQYMPTKKFGLIVGFDAGMQQKGKGISAYNYWLSPVVIARYIFHPQFTSAVRVEYYHDASGVIIPTTTENGFQVTGASLNLDYTPRPEVACRLEGRWLHGRDSVFYRDGNSVKNSYTLVVSIALKISKVLGPQSK